MPILLLVALLLRQAPAVDRDQLPALEVRAGQPPERWIRPSDSWQLRLNRPLDSRNERLAVVIGDTDWSSLFTQTNEALTYTPGPVRWPSGESSVTVYLVTTPNTWRQIATMPLRVTTPSGFESIALTPRVTVGDIGQVGEVHSPADAAPPRPRFDDATLGLGLQSQHVRSGITYASQTNLLGVTNPAQAPRFSLIGAAAPQLDLADYVWTADAPTFKVAMGQGTFIGERHLVSAGLQSRGLSFTVKDKRADVTFSDLSSTAIVGFDNFLGVSTEDNRLGLVQLGVELIPRRGGARLEFTGLDGSRLPQSSVNQRSITDAERSRGGAVRFAGSALNQRLRIDTGYARSWFINPADPLLSQGVALVPVKSRTNDAEYFDSAFDVVKNAKIAHSTPVTVTAIYKFERVDPLFNSVGAAQGLRSDLFQNIGGVQSTIGSVTGQVLRTVSNDNLGHVASILRTDTGVTAATLVIPTGTFGQSAHDAQWWPVVSWSLNRSSQIGEGLPADGGFVSPSQVPNQLNTVQDFRSEWTLSRAHVAYQLSKTFQDNRQPGRETADFSNSVNGLSLGGTIGKQLDLSSELSFEHAVSHETNQVTRTTHVNVTAAWRTRPHELLNVVVNDTLGRGPDLSLNDASDASLQYSHTFVLTTHRTPQRQLQVFGRTNWQASNSLQSLVLAPADKRRLWTFSVGLTTSIF